MAITISPIGVSAELANLAGFSDRASRSTPDDRQVVGFEQSDDSGG
jgi:hypothetical protein